MREPAAQGEVERTVFRGDDSVNVTDYWAVAVNVSGLSNINFDGDLFYGTSGGGTGAGIVLADTSAAGIGKATTLPRAAFTVSGLAWRCGPYWS